MVVPQPDATRHFRSNAKAICTYSATLVNDTLQPFTDKEAYGELAFGFLPFPLTSWNYS